MIINQIKILLFIVTLLVQCNQSIILIRRPDFAIFYFEQMPYKHHSLDVFIVLAAYQLHLG